MLRKHWFLISIFLTSTVLLSYNLDHRYLWRDEAYTAMFAKNTLKFGYPKAYDGEKFFTGTNGNDFNSKFQHVLYPWLQFYLVAGSFKIFGINTTAARIPSVLFGILSVIGMFFLSRKVTPKDKVTYRLSTIIYIFSLPFLINARFCKYFSLVLAFGIWAIYFYLSFLESKKNKHLIWFAISLILLFYSNYIAFLGVVTGIFIYHLAFVKENIKGMLIASLVVISFTLPWIIFIELHFTDCYRGLFLGLMDGGKLFLDHLLSSLWQINTQYFPFISLLLVLGISRIVKKIIGDSKQNQPRDKTNAYYLFLIICLSTILIYNVFIPLRLDWWYISILPFCVLLTTLLIRKIYAANKVLAGFVVILLIFSNVLHVLPYIVLKHANLNVLKIGSIVKPPIRANGFEPPNLYGYVTYECKMSFSLFDYLSSLNEDYNSAAEGLVQFLHNEDSSNKTIQSSILDYYLLFYTDYKIVNQLNPNMDAYGPPSVLMFSGYPNAKEFEKLSLTPYDSIDYFVITPRLDVPFPYLEYLTDNHHEFEKVYIDYPDIFDSQCFIRSPEKYAGFYVYKRKRDASSQPKMN